MIELHVRELSKSIAWYVNNLGLQVKLHDRLNSFTLLEDSQSHRIALKQSDTVSTNVIIHWEVTNLTATIETLRCQKIDVSDISVSSEGYRAVTIHDPDGIRLNLFEWV